EQEVLQRIIKGQSNRDIAQELFVTVATVKWYIKQIYGKLHVRSRVQAMVRARELHLVTNGAGAGNGASLSGVTVIPTDQFRPRSSHRRARTKGWAPSRPPTVAISLGARRSRTSWSSA